MKRIFLMGCVRSGTTLLQSLLGAHSQIHTFPETHFVGHVVGDHMRRLSFGVVAQFRQLAIRGRIALHLANRSALPRFRQTMDFLDRPDLYRLMKRHPVTYDRAIRIWAGAIDIACRDAGYKAWLEKTPMHCGYINEITSNIGGVKFIHIIRDPVAVVASMKDAARRYPNSGWSRYENSKLALTVWNRSVAFSFPWACHPNHAIVFYEDLVKNIKGTLRGICKWLEMDFREEMLTNHERIAYKVSLKTEPWKTRVGQSIKVIDKSKQVLTKEEVMYLCSHARGLEELMPFRISPV